MKECKPPLRIPDLLNAPWAITPEKLEEICSIYYSHFENAAKDLTFDFSKISNAQPIFVTQHDPNAPDYKNYRIVNGVAIIPIQGVIARRMNLFSQISGGVSTELLLRDFNDALADPAVDAIVLDVDSPGGAVGGLETLSAAIYNARGQKPVVAFAGDLMASAAYWIGSAADMIISEGTSIIGSIGVLTVHRDQSKADEKAGIKRTHLSAGAYKAIGNDAEPLTEIARKVIQDQLDYFYTLFVNDVARNRGVEPKKVLTDMADGRVFIGQQARDAGLIDFIAPLDGAVIQALSMVEMDQPKYFIRR